MGAIRATVNISTGFTPNRIMLGREVMMPLDMMLGSDRAVPAVWQTLCKLCRPLPPPAMGARLPFWGQAGHADPMDGWQCS